MNRPLAPNPYQRHRFPAELISHGVWLYFRFCPSYWDVEELMAEHGVTLTYETVRYWCGSSGRSMPISSAAGVPGQGKSGTWMKSLLTIKGQRPRHHRLSAPAYRQEMGHRVQVLWEVTGLAPVA
jgi:hypothetical protein